MKRLAVLVSLLAVVSLSFAAPVLAAAPSNDTYAGRTVIGSLPFSATVDTTQATTDANDAEVSGGFFIPTDASVWYELTPTADATIILDVSTSSYTAGFAIATGSPGSFVALAGGFGGGFAFDVLAGTTYTFLVFDTQEDGGGNGGTVTIRVYVAPPPPVVHLTLNNEARINRSGSATVSGTVRCSSASTTSSGIFAGLSQRVGRGLVIEGSGNTPQFACDGKTHRWSVEVVGNGRFKEGNAHASIGAAACIFNVCGFGGIERKIELDRR